VLEAVLMKLCDKYLLGNVEVVNLAVCVHISLLKFIYDQRIHPDSRSSLPDTS
jgi:hypothetical protein